MNGRDPLPPMTVEQFRSIRALIRGSSGIQVSEDGRSATERRLTERVHALGLSSFADYDRYLHDHERAPQEIELASELVATHETYFFRDMPQLQVFAEHLLPQLREQVDVRRSFTVWSAGCSTGEEVYTIAMLIDASGLFDDIVVRVIGTDLSRRVLQVARKGAYRGPSFRALPAQYQSYFVHSGEVRVVAPRIRASCHFAHLNLLDEGKVALVGRVDAVFCRNVLIYFDEAARKRLVGVLYDRLHPGGYLLLGHSESLLHLETQLEHVALGGAIVYRKPAGHVGSVRGGTL